MWKKKQQYLWVLGAIGSLGLAVTGFHQTVKGESSHPIIGYIFAAVALCLSIYCIWCFLRARKNHEEETGICCGSFAVSVSTHSTMCYAFYAKARGYTETRMSSPFALPFPVWHMFQGSLLHTATVQA